MEASDKAKAIAHREIIRGRYCAAASAALSAISDLVTHTKTLEQAATSSMTWAGVVATGGVAAYVVGGVGARIWNKAGGSLRRSFTDANLYFHKIASNYRIAGTAIAGGAAFALAPEHNLEHLSLALALASALAVARSAMHAGAASQTAKSILSRPPKVGEILRVQQPGRIRQPPSESHFPASKNHADTAK